MFDIPVPLLYIAAASILSLLIVDTMKLLPFQISNLVFRHAEQQRSAARWRNSMAPFDFVPTNNVGTALRVTLERRKVEASNPKKTQDHFLGLALLRSLMFLFLFSPSVSLANGWDVILLSGEAFLDVKVTEMRNDSIQIQTQEWIDWFWLGNIARIERKGTAWGLGAALGGLIGFVGGGWYAVENQDKTIDQPPVVRGILGGLIGLVPGGLLGALIGGMINTGVSYDFTRMSYDERIAVARKIILSN